MDFTNFKKQFKRTSSSNSISPTPFDSTPSLIYRNNLSKISDLPVHCNPNTSILNASLLMKEKRTHCLLIIDESSGKLIGLTTTKDLAFKAVAKNLDSNTSISSIMTKNPYYVSHLTSPNEALKLMVNKKIRHLPIVNENELVVGILNITTCFYNVMIRLEKMSETSKELQTTFNELNNNYKDTTDLSTLTNESSIVNLSNLNSTLPSIKIKDQSNNLINLNSNNLDLLALNEGLMELNISRRRKKIVNELKSLILIMKQPDLKSLLIDNELNASKPFYITAKTSIYNASQLLLQNNLTSALIIQNENNKNPILVENIIGILTTKDLVYRVLACQINSKISTVARVMTSKPEFANDSMAIHNALRLMYEGKYLNLPIKNSDNHVIGLVNVLNLTCSLLNTLNNFSLNDSNDIIETKSQDLNNNINSNSDINNPTNTNVPAWNKFWDSLDRPLNQISNSSLFASRRSYSSIEKKFGPSQRSSSFVNISSEPVKNGLSDLTFVDLKLEDNLDYYLSPKSEKQLSADSTNKTILSVKVNVVEQLKLGLNHKIYKFNLNHENNDNSFILDSIISNISNKIKWSNKKGLLFHLGYFDEERDFITIDSPDDLNVLLINKENLNLIVKIMEKEEKITDKWLFHNLFSLSIPNNLFNKHKYIIFGGLGVILVAFTKFLILAKR
jgi:CBS domain-containing protein